jgi:two-component sensor histidine kinase
MQERLVERTSALQIAVADFSEIALQEFDLGSILAAAARMCAETLEVPFCKILEYQTTSRSFLVVASYGWEISGMIITPTSQDDPSGRAFLTGRPFWSNDLYEVRHGFALSGPYLDYKIVASANVLIPGQRGERPFGVLEVDSPVHRDFDERDIRFLQSFANIMSQSITSHRTVAILRDALIEREDLLEQKETLLQELHHRVRNNLQLVYGLLIDSDRLQREISTEAIARRVLTLAQVYDHMLLQQPGPFTINLGTYIAALCEEHRRVVAARQITIDCDWVPVVVKLEAATSLGLAVNELLSVSAAHAPIGGVITVRIGSPSPGAVWISVHDHAPLDSIGAESKRSGIGLVRRLAKQTRAWVDVSNDDGRMAIIKYDQAADNLSKTA